MILQSSPLSRPQESVLFTPLLSWWPLKLRPLVRTALWGNPWEGKDVIIFPVPNMMPACFDNQVPYGNLKKNDYRMVCAPWWRVCLPCHGHERSSIKSSVESSPLDWKRPIFWMATSKPLKTIISLPRLHLCSSPLFPIMMTIRRQSMSSRRSLVW